MRTKPLATALAALATIATIAAAGAAHAGDGPFTANVGLVSDYAYRGWSQTDERPALQGGFDYAHDSGLYAGVWGSNVSWLSDSQPGRPATASSSTSTAATRARSAPSATTSACCSTTTRAATRRAYNSPNTLEGYIGLSWEFLSFKYSYAFTDLFGYEKSDGSQYYDLGAAVDVGGGFTLAAHVGYSDIKGQDDYTDWKLGVTKEFGGFNFGLHYVDTDVDNADLADERVILSIAKSF